MMPVVLVGALLLLCSAPGAAAAGNGFSVSNTGVDLMDMCLYGEVGCMWWKAMFSLFIRHPV